MTSTVSQAELLSCPEQKKARELMPKLTRANRIVALQRLRNHERNCPICSGREPPLTSSEAVVDTVLRSPLPGEDWEHTPWWLAPVGGAAALGLLTFAKIGWVVLWGWLDPPTAVKALGYIGLAMAIGAVGGLAFSIAYAMLGRVWWARYPSAFVAFAIPLLLLQIAADYTDVFGPEPRKWNTWVTLVVAIFFAVSLAHEAHDPKEIEGAA